MSHSAVSTAGRSASISDRSAGSFLVRVWYETRETAEEPPTFRGYIRNLLTGEERFIRDPKTVSEQILKQMGTGPHLDAAGGGGNEEEGEPK